MMSPRERALFAAATLTPEINLIGVPVQEYLLPVDLLRHYQYDMLVEAARLMRLGYRRILLVLPTGGGKTVIASSLLSSTTALGYRSQFIVHRRELIKQTSVTFNTNGLHHGFIASGMPMTFDANVTLAGIQTLVNRLDLVLPPYLTVVDEAHHATAASWGEVLSYYGDNYVIGLTATPERLDGCGLGEHFDVMVIGPSVADLIEWGYLSPYQYYAPNKPDMKGVATTAGDYSRSAAAEIMDKPVLIGDTVEHYLRTAKGAQGIVFAVNREHSRHIADAFRAEGVRAAHVDGSMTDKEREWHDAAFRARDIDVLTNVDLFGEGYDVPGLVYCGLARPTKSIGLHKQQVGRPLRIFPGKSEAIICDHAGNVYQHGLPDDDIEWSLQGKKGRKSASGTVNDATPIKTCKTCYRIQKSTEKVCIGCGTEFPANQREVETKDGELAKLEAAEVKRRERVKRKAEERMCKSYETLKILAETRGYKNPSGWAKMKMKLRSNAKARYGR